MIEHQNIQMEQDHLQQVIQVIAAQLGIITKQTQDAKKQVRAIKRSLWEDLQFGSAASFEQEVEAVQYLDELYRQGRIFGVHRQALVKLELLAKAPYFGRIDFYDRELDTVMPIYIGVASLVDHRTGQHLVYDWRAPVSSMFYDYGLGPAEYQSPGGIISGEILLKRQYRIEDNEIKYMFDSELTISDDILQDTLSKSADQKMRNIVYTIQREQNQAIRDESAQVLLVQGPAGSGKTSIALHRAAYLIYRHQDTISASQIGIFSPNQIFSDYISNVLPELGEDNIVQATMEEYSEQRIGADWVSENFLDQYAAIFRDDSSSPEDYLRKEALGYKSSPEFFRLVKAYGVYITKKKFIFDDLYMWDQLILSKGDFANLFYETYAYLPVKSRLEKIQRRIAFLLDTFKEARINQLIEGKAATPVPRGTGDKNRRRQICQNMVEKELTLLYQRLAADYTVNIYELYQNLYRGSQVIAEFAPPDLLPANWEQICEFTLRNLNNRRLLHEDLAPLLYLDCLITGGSSMGDIKHVIVDEAQDYSLFHYEILRNLFPKAAFTILGDEYQTLYANLKPMKFDLIKEIFNSAGIETKRIYLTKSYRATRQIAGFTRSLLPVAIPMELMARDGAKPKVRIYGADPAEDLVHAAAECLTLGCKSVAIICKTEQESVEAAQLLAGHLEFHRISREESSLVPGVVVLAISMAKGLEFDAVIMYDASAQAYADEDEGNLLYIACTRALHYLYIFYRGTLTPFITGVDRGLYELS